MELARQATDAFPRTADYWNTLGLALYRSGDAQGAIAALNESLELLSGGDAFDWFLLAMAEHRMGNQTAARQWFEKAVEWFGEQNPRTRKRILPLYAEAEKCLDFPGRLPHNHAVDDSL